MKKKVLVVDDEQRIRHIYARTIRAAASNIFDVYEASDAWEASELLSKEKMDVILLDLRMPRVNGLQLFEIIRHSQPETKVIVASVFSVEQQKKLVPEAKDYYDKSQGTLALLDKLTSAVI